ncbi:Flp pilus assembly CpaF family ATPase [Massilia sp. UYP11]
MRTGNCRCEPNHKQRPPGLVINDAGRTTLTRNSQNEMVGFGPLERLLADPSVSDILVNTHKQDWVERRSKLERTDVTFTDDAQLTKIIDKIAGLIALARR